MTPIEYGIERALVFAGAWYPGMGAEILAAAGNEPTSEAIDAAIAERVKNCPEKFISARDRRTISEVEDPSERYASALEKIASRQFNVLSDLRKFRESEA